MRTGAPGELIRPRPGLQQGGLLCGKRFMATSRIGKPLDFTDVKTWSARERGGAFDASRLAGVPDVRLPLAQFFNSLPNTRKSRELLEAAEHIVLSAANGRQNICLMDASVLELGLSPLIIKLMERNLVHHVAMDGTAAARDFETAFFGQVRDDAAKDLQEGLQGMARETGEWVNALINDGARRGFGIGYSLGRGILDRRAAYDGYSILANGASLRIPLTVHIGIGADSFQLHPSADGSLLGKGAYKDFQMFAGQVPEIHQGGMVLDFCATDFLSRVFLKALNVARNLGHSVSNFLTLDLGSQSGGDPAEAPLRQATRENGRSYSFKGHAELMLPLLFAAVQRLVR